MHKLPVLALLCAGLLASGAVIRPAAAQSPDDVQQWLENLRERMGEEFDRVRERMDGMRDGASEQLDELQEELERRLRQLTGETEDRPAGTAAWLGINVAPLDEQTRGVLRVPEGQGVLVNNVTEGGPADGRLQDYDVILSANGTAVGTVEQLGNLIRSHAPGAVVEFELIRDGQRQTITVELGRRPGNGAAPVVPRDPMNPDDLERLLEDAFEEGDVPDPEPDDFAPLEIPNPFGEGGFRLRDVRDMVEQGRELLEGLQDARENPEALGRLAEQLRRMLGEEGEPGQGPADAMRDALERLLDGIQPGEDAPPPAPVERPWLGVSAVDTNEDLRANGIYGVQVTRVIPGSPADQAGLQRGDIIVAFNGAEVRDREALKDAMDRVDIGDEVRVRISRDGETITLPMTIGGR